MILKKKNLVKVPWCAVVNRNVVRLRKNRKLQTSEGYNFQNDFCKHFFHHFFELLLKLFILIPNSSIISWIHFFQNIEFENIILCIKYNNIRYIFQILATVNIFKCPQNNKNRYSLLIFKLINYILFCPNLNLKWLGI